MQEMWTERRIKLACAAWVLIFVFEICVGVCTIGLKNQIKLAIRFSYGGARALAAMVLNYTAVLRRNNVTQDFLIFW